MKNIKKQIPLYFISLCATFLLCGCVHENSNPPSKAEVTAAVAKEVAGEKVTIDHVEHLNCIPKKDIYYFKSTERDFSFQVESYIRCSDIGIGSSGPYVYSKDISIHYWDALKEYYKADMDEILKDSTKYHTHYDYVFHDYDELMDIYDKVTEAEKCFSNEANYHTDPNWYKDHVLTSVVIKWDSQQNDASGKPNTVSLFPVGYHIYANSSPERTFQKISEAYVSKIISEEIPADPKIPAELLSLGHVDKLTHVIINNTEMTDELSYMLNMTPTVPIDGVFYAEYNFDYNCYMMRIDPGCGSKTRTSHPLQAIIKAAGGTGGDKCDNLNKEEWDIGSDHFILTADRDYGSTHINGITLKKNGQPMEITYTNRTDLTRSSYMVMISIDDIAKMLEMTVTVDEANGTVIFEKQ